MELEGESDLMDRLKELKIKREKPI